LNADSEKQAIVLWEMPWVTLIGESRTGARTVGEHLWDFETALCEPLEKILGLEMRLKIHVKMECRLVLIPIPGHLPMGS
jgi:hypothetical protein